MPLPSDCHVAWTSQLASRLCRAGLQEALVALVRTGFGSLSGLSVGRSFLHPTEDDRTGWWPAVQILNRREHSLALVRK